MTKFCSQQIQKRNAPPTEVGSQRDDASRQVGHARHGHRDANHLTTRCFGHRNAFADLGHDARHDRIDLRGRAIQWAAPRIHRVASEIVDQN